MVIFAIGRQSFEARRRAIDRLVDRAHKRAVGGLDVVGGDVATHREDIVDKQKGVMDAIIDGGHQ